MIYLPQAGPPTLAAPAPVPDAGRSTIERLAPSRPKGCAADAGDVVVCARDQDAFRLRPLPPLPGSPGFFQRPHVLNLAPNVAIGFIGNGKGPGVRVEF